MAGWPVSTRQIFLKKNDFIFFEFFLKMTLPPGPSRWRVGPPHRLYGPKILPGPAKKCRLCGLARFATPSCAISIPDFSLFKAYQLNRQKNKQKKIKACKIIINSPTAQYTVHFPFLAIYMYPTKLFSSPYWLLSRQFERIVCI